MGLDRCVQVARPTLLNTCGPAMAVAVPINERSRPLHELQEFGRR
jgi:hypothetical protein